MYNYNVIFYIRMAYVLPYVFWLIPFLPNFSFGLQVMSLPASVCQCVCVCVRSCVYQSRACLCDNSLLVQARITRFRVHVQKTLDKVPIDLYGDRPWPTRSSLTWDSNFTLFWACPYIDPFKLEFGPEMLLSTVKIHMFFRLIDINHQGQINLKI